MTAKEIAYKYVHGKHDAFTDNQEKIEMESDIIKFAEDYCNKKNSK